MPEKWDHDGWIKAWGWNAPMIVGSIGDDALTNALPSVPRPYTWLVTRHVDGLKRSYSLSLFEIGEHIPWPRVVSVGTIPTDGDLGKTQAVLVEQANELLEGIE